MERKINLNVNITDVLESSNKLLASGEARNLPEHSRDKLAKIATIAAPVDKCKKLGECLYACRGDITPALCEIVAQCFQLSINYGWLSGADVPRAISIINAMRRDCGESGDWPLAEDDPEPLSEYIAPQSLDDVTTDVLIDA